jgi:hypothetical protein
MKKPTPYQFLLSEFGSPDELANAIGCHRSTVFRWRNHPINMKWVKKIRLESKFKLNLQHLRPDLYSQDPDPDDH